MNKLPRPYKLALENGFAECLTRECPPENRLEFLGDQVFNFTTYHGDISALFARKAVEVCVAILRRTTFKYIEDEDNYRWYLIMCNMPFFADRIDWGTSIRGAWFEHGMVEFECCALYVEGKQYHETLKFTGDEWRGFIQAIIEFAAPEMKKGGVA